MIEDFRRRFLRVMERAHVIAPQRLRTRPIRRQRRRQVQVRVLGLAKRNRTAAGGRNLRYRGF
jgi:hypothetical protein